MSAFGITIAGSGMSKGARKRQLRRQARVAAEIGAGKGAAALERRVIEGMHELRRRGRSDLVGGAFPFVAELLLDIAATFGGQAADSVRGTLEHEAVLAVARATGSPAPRVVADYGAVPQRRLREIRAIR